MGYRVEISALPCGKIRGYPVEIPALPLGAIAAELLLYVLNF